MTRVLVVGGGAAGFFAAITCAERNKDARVILCEATAHLLAKVRISGGGRCNVTHACFEPAELVKHYPRGARELLGPMHRWQPRDTVDWFESRGVKLKTEEDGRMFPVTDDSATIVDCLMREATKAGVEVRVGVGITAVAKAVRPSTTTAPSGNQSPEGLTAFAAQLTDGSTLDADRVLIATGGNKSSAGLEIARKLGHTVEPPVPSLFTFHVKDPRIEGLAGVSAADAEVSFAVNPNSEIRMKNRARGALLITHGGLSGPAILRLSAWGARPLAACNYVFSVKINFAPELSHTELEAALRSGRAEHARKQIASWCPVPIPTRLWERLIVAAGISAADKWSALANDRLSALSAQLSASEFAVTGKSMNKEEFVTCGGVRLAEVNFKTMESRLVPGLHFAGEVLDIDGLTGGFNFQSAWTTGRLAGEAMASGLETAKGRE